MKRMLVIFLGLVCSTGLAGCGGGDKDECTGGDTRCDGDLLMGCSGGKWVQTRDCAADGDECVADAQGASCEAPGCSAGDTRCDGDVLMGCTDGEWTQTQDCAASGATCVAGAQGASCVQADPWDVVVRVKIGDAVEDVSLAELTKTTYDDHEAVQLSLVIDQTTLELPWNQSYDFVGSDGWDVLVEKLSGDPSGLPIYPELEQGFLYWSDEDGLVIGWDLALGLPRYMNIKQMNGGTIEALPIDPARVRVQAPAIRTLIDVTALATVDVTDYRHPENGAVPMVPLPAVLTAAQVADPETLSYQFCGNDGFCNPLDNLLPAANLDHCYLEPTGRAVVCDDGFDHNRWRVRDVVLFRGHP